MTSNHSIFSSDLDASTLHCVLDKPSISEDFNFMKKFKQTLCNKCGLHPKYPLQGLCKKCYREKQQRQYLEKRTIKVIENLPGEEWKEINGAESYHVSNLGRIKSTNFWCRLVTDSPNEKLIKLREARKGGYLKADLDRYKWRPSVHRIVAIHFIPNPNNLPLVLHKDNNKQNNVYTNLYWGSISENRIDYINHTNKNGITRSKMPKQQVLDIFNSDLSVQQIATRYNIQPSTVWMIKTGYRWSSITGIKSTDKRGYEKNK